MGRWNGDRVGMQEMFNEQEIEKIREEIHLPIKKAHYDYVASFVRTTLDIANTMRTQVKN